MLCTTKRHDTSKNHVVIGVLQHKCFGVDKEIIFKHKVNKHYEIRMSRKVIPSAFSHKIPLHCTGKIWENRDKKVLISFIVYTID